MWSAGGGPFWSWSVRWLLILTICWPTPIYDPNRCGIGFHPLHSYPAIAVYLVLLVSPVNWLRLVALGLVIHMFLDGTDCLWIRFE